MRIIINRKWQCHDIVLFPHGYWERAFSDISNDSRSRTFTGSWSLSIASTVIDWSILLHFWKCWYTEDDTFKCSVMLVYNSCWFCYRISNIEYCNWLFNSDFVFKTLTSFSTLIIPLRRRTLSQSLNIITVHFHYFIQFSDDSIHFDLYLLT